MKPGAIVDYAKDANLFSDKLSGLTPHQTMKAKISVDIRSKGTASRFVRTGPNTFFLRELIADESKIYNAVRQPLPRSREVVITFPSSLLDSIGRFQGITRKVRPYFQTVLQHSVSIPMPRMQAEQTEENKQLLTYILVTQGEKLLCFRRGSFNRVEDYLRGSLCIGFGGHISQDDLTLFNTTDYGEVVLESAIRELSEELQLPDSEKTRLSSRVGLKVAGLLNDDSSPTGRKHLAAVLRYELSPSTNWQDPSRGEKSITQLRWLDLSSLDAEVREFEYWSQLCLSTFFPRAIRTQPSFLIRRRAPFKRAHILVIVGSIGSGKSAATQVLTSEFGYREINSGRAVAKLLGIPPIPQTNREDFQKKAWRFISSKRGPSRLAEAILEESEKIGNLVLIDGIRQRTTLEELRNRASMAVAVIYVYTPPHIAFEFYSSRNDQFMSIHDFLKLYDAPVEADIKKMLAGADAVLYNWSGKIEYQRVVRNLMRELSR